MVAFTFISCDEPEAPHEHKWDKGTITTEASCTKEGVMTYTCACGETKTESIPAKGHTEVVDVAVAPTCIEKGKIEGKHCSVCETVIVAQEDVEALGHSIDATGTCKRCNATGLKAAKIGDNEYTTLSEAVDAARDGDTITMLCDSAGDGIKFQSELFNVNGLTIDLNGKIYSIVGKTVGSTGTETNAFQLLKNNKITFKNGTIVAGTDAVKLLFQNYCDLTLDNVIAKGSANTEYISSNNFGHTIYKNGTKLIATEGNVAFDVYYWPKNSYTEGVSVEILTSDVEIVGKVEFTNDGTIADWFEKASLTIPKGYKLTVEGDFIWKTDEATGKQVLAQKAE